MRPRLASASTDTPSLARGKHQGRQTMTNHTPTFMSSAASGSFTETANTTGSAALHTLSGTMAFKDSDKTDTHTTTAALKSAVWSGGSGIPAGSLAHFNSAVSSQILTDTNGNGSLKWN